jgi:primosomal replication protein N
VLTIETFAPTMACFVSLSRTTPSSVPVNDCAKVSSSQKEKKSQRRTKCLLKAVMCFLLKQNKKWQMITATVQMEQA